MARNNRKNTEDHLGKGAGIFFGILLILVGLVALGSFTVTTYATVFFLGWVMLIGGLIRIVQAFGGHRWSGFFLDLFIGLLISMGGVLLINNPTAGILVTTLLLSLIFMVSGFSAVISSLAIRYPNWGWYFAYGVLVFFFGIAVWRHWPVSGIFLIGLFIGLELIISGVTLIAGSVSPQRASTPTTTAVSM